jgi:hypothetical protein
MSTKRAARRDEHHTSAGSGRWSAVVVSRSAFPPTARGLPQPANGSRPSTAAFHSSSSGGAGAGLLESGGCRKEAEAGAMVRVQGRCTSKGGTCNEMWGPCSRVPLV